MCQSCNANIQYAGIVVQREMNGYNECNACITTPNMTPNLPECQCNTGFYFDGTQCQNHITGTIFFEDFESPTSLNDNWIGRGPAVGWDNSFSAQRITPAGYTSTAVNFLTQVLGGDIYWRNHYQTLKHNGSYILMFDFFQDKPQENFGLAVCSNTLGQNFADHNWIMLSTFAEPPVNGITSKVVFVDQQWRHIEYHGNFDPRMPFNICFEDFSATNLGQIYIDNVRLVSVHGPNGNQQSPFSHIHPTIQILSIDYNGYDGNLNDQRFHFDRNAFDTLIGRTNWNNELFAVYIAQIQVTAQVRLFNTPDGGSIGDARGQFETPLAFNGQRHFNPGGHIVFANNFTSIVGDFVLQDNYRNYKGPFYTENDKNLNLCYNNCQDFQTLDQAINQCDLDTNCHGVLFSHHNYEGTLSTGFNSLQGYGYQLRQWQAKTDNTHLLYEYSYIKNFMAIKFACTGTDPACSLCSDASRQAPGCLCRTNFYDDGVPICPPCNYPCITCTGAATCTSCQTPTNRVSPTNCDCLPTFYDDNTQCQPCNYPCQNCSGATTCTSCQTPTNRVSSTNCDCLPTFYDDNTQCQPCNYPCQNCSDASTCLSCQNPGNRVSTTNCDCLTTFYDDNTQCQPCNYPCLNCSDGSTCTSCQTPSNRVSSTNCDCLPTFYDDNSQCQPCNYPCLNCSDGSTCESCATTGNRVSLTDCRCQNTFYDDNSQCQPCNYPCQNCSDASTCTSCQNSSNRVSTTNCDCLPTFYDDNTQCQPCNYPCLNCSDGSTCTSCQTPTNRVSTTNCDCLPTFYDDNTQCQPCNYPCLNCSDGSTCTSCQTPTNRVSPTNCDCLPTFYDDNTQCQPCNYPCQNCSGATTCTSCQTPTNRVSSTNCDCLPTFYDDNTQCQPCNYPCLNCSDASTCESCATTGNRVSLTDCRCQDTFYDDNSQCQPCNYPCLNCLDKITCLTCQNLLYRVSISDCNCQQGYYETGSDCQPCIHPCTQCRGGNDQCTECVSGPNRNILHPCQCHQGYFEDSSLQCQKCGLVCKLCESDNGCTTCALAIGRNLILPQCGCEIGYFEIQGQLDCGLCQSQCLQCEQNSNNCTQCLNNELLPPLCIHKKSQFTIIVDGSNLNIIKCNKQCVQCTNSESNCLKCAQNSFRLNNPPYCQCMEGYHDMSGKLQDCVKCPANCRNCIDENTCIQCQEKENFELKYGVCTCREGYKFQTDKQLCVECYYYHNECVINCPLNTVLLKDQKICQDKTFIQYIFAQNCNCPSNTYFSPTNWNCSPNPSQNSPVFIRNCSKYVYSPYFQQVRCTQCEPGYYFQESYNQPSKCIRTDVKYCNIIGQTNYLQEANPVSKFVQLLASSGGPYSCDECDKGRYWDGRMCQKNPVSQGRGFIPNCSYYSFISGNARCNFCEDGYYLDVKSYYSRKCIKNPSNTGCQIYVKNQQKSSPECVKCQYKNYVVDQYGDCVSPQQFVPKCVRGSSYNNNNQFKCIECEDSFYVSFNGQQCIQFNKNQYSCQKMVQDVFGDLQCSECLNNYYYFSTKTKKCEIIGPQDDTKGWVQNCKYYTGYPTDDFYPFTILTCQECLDGYQPNLDNGKGITQCRRCPY